MLSENELLQRIELLAHKLKNPSHTMGLNLEVLRAKIEKSDLASKTELLNLMEIIGRELQRQNQIIQRHMQFITPGGSSPRPLKLKNLLTLLKAEVFPAAQAQQVNLEFGTVDSDVMLQANETEILAALREFVFNAIEASRAGETVTIRAGATAGEVVLEIEDHGTGIEKAEAGKILELYYSNKKGHLGMGLPLAKKYIEENGGKLRLRTAVNKGTTIQISFEK
jgi:signal transduction histidine kinase